MSEAAHTLVYMLTYVNICTYMYFTHIHTYTRTYVCVFHSHMYVHTFISLTPRGFCTFYSVKMSPPNPHLPLPCPILLLSDLRIIVDKQKEKISTTDHLLEEEAKRWQKKLKDERQQVQAYCKAKEDGVSMTSEYV